MEQVLYATRKGDPDWKEELITSTSDSARLAAAETWAREHGFDRLRVTTFDMSKPPDFVGAIKGRKRATRTA